MEDLPTSTSSLAGLSLNSVLAFTAIGLLVFVSGGVLYLSTVEWRDRRRRSKAAPAKR
jgi:hypothetical protein